MHPELFTLPIFGIPIKTYGVCMMVGFLSAVWLAMRRAARVRVDPDRVLDLSFLALVFGVGGARAFYVIHYWDTHFAPVKNKFLAIIDIREGGLEFLGGFVGAMVAAIIFLMIKKQSIRLFLDILAPSLMWGLACGRIGCFFNGCCFGGLCVIPPTDEAKYPWAVQFPYGSPAHVRQWEDRQVTVPAELLVSGGFGTHLLRASILDMSVERRERPQREVEEFKDALARAKASDADGAVVQALAAELKVKEAALAKHRDEAGLADLEWAQRYPSRRNLQRSMSVTELEDLAGHCKSLPVHPTQLYSSMNALLLSGVLSAVFYYRKRHGIVIGLMMVLYPINRFIIELIRTDNPHDVYGLTVSQLASVIVFVCGIMFLAIVYMKLPERSPRADTAVAVEE